MGAQRSRSVPSHFTSPASLNLLGIKRDIIVIGASAGGVPALRRLFAALPPDLPAAVNVVLHPGAQHGGLASVEVRDSSMPIVELREKKPVRRTDCD